MANIYDTPITVYRGTDYNPDGTPIPWSFCAAFFDEEEYTGEFLFCIDENGNIYPVGTVGNADEIESEENYNNYCEMLIATAFAGRKNAASGVGTPDTAKIKSIKAIIQ